MAKLKASDFEPSLDLSGRRVAVDTEARKIAVRVAAYGEAHSGFGPQVKVPTNANLDAAHVGTADLEDGTTTRVAVLPMHTTHAPNDLKALHAAAWYENSGLGVARGKYTADEEGVRFDGVLFDDITDAQMDRLTAGSASGDWRAAIAIKKFSDYETTPCDFVGSCLVNVPGYSDTFTSKPAQRLALVASGAGDFMLIEDAALTAASVGPDGLSESDVREAWIEANPTTSTGGDVMPYDGGWSIEEFYVAPQYIIVRNWASPSDDYLSVTWDVDADGTITFGERTPVEQTWTPIQEADEMQDPLTAGGDAGETVAVPASALTTLLEQQDALHDDSEEYKSAREAATSALIAGGHMQAPDPRDARLAALEALVIQQAFRD